MKFIGFIEAVRCATDKNVDILDVTHIEPRSVIRSEIEKQELLFMRDDIIINKPITYADKIMKYCAGLDY